MDMHIITLLVNTIVLVRLVPQCSATAVESEYVCSQWGSDGYWCVYMQCHSVRLMDWPGQTGHMCYYERYV